jgi:FlaA1/EpsC-like NDP-sugar epimerase
LVAALPIWLVAKSITFVLSGQDKGLWRYVSILDVVRLGFINLVAAAISGAAILLLAPPGFPRSIYFIDVILCFGFTAGLRLGIRVVHDLGHRRAANGGEHARTFIYGAGQAGISLLREIQRNPALPYSIVGFLDDDANKHGLSIQGVRVYCASSTPEEARRLSVETVLIAIPSATGGQMTRILDLCSRASVSYKTIPGMAEVIAGRALASQIRDVDVEDLLGRDPVRLEEDRIAERYEGRVMMVTGAAGSIGSELCRQLARFRPSAIVGYEIAETPLFHLEREMAAAFPNVAFHPVVGCVQDLARIEETLEEYRPVAVFHAAAYKHVPMMETHVFAALRNNVFGTWRTAASAARYGVKEFVMISTDKAVNPTSAMGATKRLAELVVNSLQNGATKFVSVRFGNVLGSNGSVIPIFKRQIASGGPVTVTHPDMRRYFMTIPEASQLVLQASTMASGGEVFVLDMGESVRIVDLARNLILLSGLRPDVDIEIRFTGVRPGEKLFEEINSASEHHLPTAHEKILVFAANGQPEASMSAYLEQLQEICDARDLPGLLLILKEIIPEYNPSSSLLERALSSSGISRSLAASA